MSLPLVQPIVPIAAKVPFDDPAWLFDLKYDGFRALCYVEPGRTRFLSRNGNVLSRFDELALKVAAELAIEEAILDGEVIAPDETGRPVFLALLKRSARPAYIAFDLLRVNGCDQRGLPLSVRRRALQHILPPGSRVVSEALSVVGRGRSLFALTHEHDLEGIVAKKLADPYEPSTRWLKIKNAAYSQTVGRADLFNHSGKRAKQFPVSPLSKP